MSGARPGLARMSLILKDKPRLDFEVLVVQDYEAEKAKLKASFIELNRLIRDAFPTASVTATAEFTPDGGGIPIVPGGPGYIVMMGGFELPVKAMRQQISSALDIVIQANRLQGGPRKITSITEVMNMKHIVQDCCMLRHRQDTIWK